MKTLYGNAGSGPASKSIQRKTLQIPPYGYIAAIGLVASAEQAYAKQVGVSDVVTSKPSTLMTTGMYCWIYQILMYLALPLIQQIYMPLLLICPARRCHHLEQHHKFAGLQHRAWFWF